jgi:hypothetical protein
VKIVINGESFDYDSERRPMSEALAIEDAYKRRYVEWQADLIAGSARAMCVLVWLIWRRDGRDVPYEHIIDGTVDLDVEELMQSIVESSQAAAEAAPDPTTPGATPDPDGTPGTVTATSGASPSTSTSARGKSKS